MPDVNAKTLLHRSDRQWASSTSSQWHNRCPRRMIGAPLSGSYLGPHRNFSATRPSVDVQSVSSFYRNFGLHECNEFRLSRKCKEPVDSLGSPRISARRKTRSLASQTSGLQRRNAPVSAARNGIFVIFASQRHSKSAGSRVCWCCFGCFRLPGNTAHPASLCKCHPGSRKWPQTRAPGRTRRHRTQPACAVARFLKQPSNPHSPYNPPPLRGLSHAEI